MRLWQRMLFLSIILAICTFAELEEWLIITFFSIVTSDYFITSPSPTLMFSYWGGSCLIDLIIGGLFLYATKKKTPRAKQFISAAILRAMFVSAALVGLFYVYDNYPIMVTAPNPNYSVITIDHCAVVNNSYITAEVGIFGGKTQNVTVAYVDGIEEPMTPSFALVSANQVQTFIIKSDTSSWKDASVHQVSFNSSDNSTAFANVYG